MLTHAVAESRKATRGPFAVAEKGFARLKDNMSEGTVSTETLSVEVEWSEITGLHDEQWEDNFCLYAYVDPVLADIHYIGHTKYGSIRRRKYGEHKKGVYELIFEQTGFEKKRLRVLRGDIWLENGKRRSKKLLLQVETLLIHRLKPCGNTTYIYTRNNSRPGMWVECTGHWPHTRTRFRDSESDAEYAIRSRRRDAPRNPRRTASPAVRTIRRILRAVW